MAVLVEDQFTDTNGTALASHAPDTDPTGSGWQGAHNYTIQNNRCQLASTVYDRYALIDTGQTAYFDITATFENPNGAGWGAIVWASENTNSTGGSAPNDRWWIHTQSGTYSLRRMVSGSEVELASASGASTGPEEWRIRAGNGSVTLEVDGVEVLSWSGTTNFVGSYAGLRGGEPNTYYFDNFVVADADGPAAVIESGITSGTGTGSGSVANATVSGIASVTVTPSSATILAGEGVPSASDDFEAQTIGVTNNSVAGWTVRWLPAGDSFEVIGNSGPGGTSKALQINAPTADYRLLSLDAADAMAASISDVDVLALVWTDGTDISTQLLARASGDIADDTNDALGLDILTGDTLRLTSLVDNVFDSVNVPYAYSAGWHWLRMQTEGNVQRGKAWAYGTPEPASWMITRDVTFFGQASGWVGVGSWSASPASIVDEFTVTDLAGQATAGGTVQLTADVVVASGSPDTSVTWGSDNEPVATVDNTGLVTGFDAGTAIITATSTFDSSKSDTSTITVRDAQDIASGVVSGVGAGSGSGTAFLDRFSSSVAGAGVGVGTASAFATTTGSAVGAGVGAGTASAFAARFGVATGGGLGASSANAFLVVYATALPSAGVGAGSGVGGIELFSSPTAGAGAGAGAASGEVGVLGVATGAGVGSGTVADAHVLVYAPQASGTGLGMGVSSPFVSTSGVAQGEGIGASTARALSIAQGTVAGAAEGSGTASAQVLVWASSAGVGTGSGVAVGQDSSVVVGAGAGTSTASGLVLVVGVGAGAGSSTSSASGRVLVLANVAGVGVGASSADAFLVVYATGSGVGASTSVVSGTRAVLSAGMGVGSGTGFASDALSVILSGLVVGAGSGVSSSAGLVSNPSMLADATVELVTVARSARLVTREADTVMTTVRRGRAL